MIKYNSSEGSLVNNNIYNDDLDKGLPIINNRYDNNLSEELPVINDMQLLFAVWW